MIGFIRRKAESFVGWLRDPWCGDRMTRPVSRQIASTGESTALILTHRGLTALGALLYRLLVDVPLYLARFVGGIMGDLWRSDYSYTRYYGGMLVDALVWTGKIILDIVVTVATTLGGLLRDLINRR
ncbi:hypothetical protein ACLI4R_17160 [Natrialbaceae archaeon A-chndr2]